MSLDDDLVADPRDGLIPEPGVKSDEQQSCFGRQSAQSSCVDFVELLADVLVAEARAPTLLEAILTLARDQALETCFYWLPVLVKHTYIFVLFSLKGEGHQKRMA